MSNPEPVRRYVVRQMDLHPDGPSVLMESRMGPRVVLCLADAYDQDIKALRKGLEFQVERTCDAGELNDVLREERDAALASLAAADEELAEQAKTIERLEHERWMLAANIHARREGTWDAQETWDEMEQAEEIADAALEEKEARGCPDCTGTGNAIDGPQGHRDCPTCDGTGKITALKEARDHEGNSRLRAIGESHE